MATRQEIAKLYVATFNRAADASGLAYWDGTGAVTTSLTDIEDIASAMLESPEAAALYAGLDREATVIKMYDNLFNRTVDGTDTGVIYWVSGGGSTVDLNLMIKALIDGALGADKTTINNKATVGTAFADAGLDSISQAISVMQDVTSDSSTVTDALQVINEVAGNGNTYSLTTGTDTITGTAGDDMFEAYLGQNSTAGGVSNTLSSADKLAGGAGEDSLYAQIVPEFFGSTGDNQIDIQVRTSGIENVEFEARDNGSNDTTNTLVTVDAKNMTGVEKIGSTYSDGDLVIENLTTLTDAGDIRHTSAMTITMDHTDNFNSDEDASDLTVYFDEDYLNTTTTDSGSTLTINMINSLNLAVADGSSLIEGFETVTFSVGSDLITVDVAGKELTDVQGLIEAALADAGYSDISVSTYTEPAYFATTIYYAQTGTTYTAGSYAGTYTAFQLTNSGSEELTEGGFTILDGQNDGSLAYSQDDNEAQTQTNPISINVELEKVGRDGEGGNLIIGGKDQNTQSDTDVDQHDGINVFNITVIGDEDKPSNLGIIQSTNNELDIVTVASATGTDAADAAALTVRGDETLTDANANSNTLSTRPFGGTLTTFDANAFLGDLYIGQEVYAYNIDTFTATGGGDVLLNEMIALNSDGTGSFASLNDNAYTVTTAGGNDTITIDANSGAQLTVTTGAGSDEITVFIDGQDDSGSDETTATISSISGDNTVTVSGTNGHVANIDLGSGSDEVNGNEIAITADTGAGDDVIYAENTGNKAAATLAATANGQAGLGTTAMSANSVNNVELLYGQTVRVTLSDLNVDNTDANSFTNGFEATAEIVATDGYLTTELDLYTAIANAINEDDVLKELAKAEIDSNGNLTVTSLIDGKTTSGDELVQWELLDNDWTTGLNDTERNGITNDLRAKYKDSDIGVTVATDVSAAYDAVATASNTITATGTTAGNPAIYTVALQDLTAAGAAAEDVTYDFLINGVATSVTVSVDPVAPDTTQSAAEQAAALVGSTVVANGVTYTIADAGAGSITLTGNSNTDDNNGTIVLEATNANADSFIAAAAAPTTLGVDTVGAGTDSTEAVDNVVNGGLGDDVIVLSSHKVDANQTDTVVFDAGDIGDDTIVHFDDGANGDLLDFSAWLNNETDVSTGTPTAGDSANPAAVTLVAATAMTANSVTVVDFDAIQAAYGTTDIDFSTLTNAQVLAALNGTATGGDATDFVNVATANLVGDAQHSILLIEHDADASAPADSQVDNLGHYLVVEVVSDDTDAGNNTFVSATIIGSVDFGESQAFTVENFDFLA
jgi:hypothetical protein